MIESKIQGRITPKGASLIYVYIYSYKFWSTLSKLLTSRKDPPEVARWFMLSLYCPMTLRMTAFAWMVQLVFSQESSRQLFGSQLCQACHSKHRETCSAYVSQLPRPSHALAACGSSTGIRVRGNEMWVFDGKGIGWAWGPSSDLPWRPVWVQQSRVRQILQALQSPTPSHFSRVSHTPSPGMPVHEQNIPNISSCRLNSNLRI